MSRHKYVIRNSDINARQIVVEYPVRPGWKLAEGVKPEETSASYYRFRVAVEGGKSGELQLEEYSTHDERFELTDMDEEHVKYLSVLVASNHITLPLKDALQRIVQKKLEIATVETQAGAKQREMDAIEKDQARLRENMKALKGSTEERSLTQRYTHELESQEDKLADLRKEKEGLGARKERAQQEFDTMVQLIALDERF